MRVMFHDFDTSGLDFFLGEIEVEWAMKNFELTFVAINIFITIKNSLKS